MQQYIFSVKILDTHLSAATAAHTSPSDRTSDPTVMRDIVRYYYQHLYTTDSVSDDEIEVNMSHVYFNHRVYQDDNEEVMEPITIDDLLEQAQRNPTQSSLGNDGLGYQCLKILFNILSLKSLLLKVHNHALTEASTPSS
ncbi:hypothetical protein BCV72DRAFT_246290 [Rhizopus microsporus var. microsporus]|uniref:Uncharacterized protein n=1 Tax=Rhizopus microsporus var. microsporus TaxID=86635 RepID=A0A1X0QMH9_RHIZD|nr:hypothetical protein BCV72DRAFT_246290 [Rhizopus microsporus var. microsporus]